MKLSITANCWPMSRQQQQQQIDKITTLPVERVYMGETVCSQRDRLSPRQLAEICQYFAKQGKQVVLSSLNLAASKRDLELLQQLVSLPDVIIEANDMAAVSLAHKHGLPFIAGSGLNIYNGASLNWLLSLGMVGYQPPLEMPAATLQALMDQADQLGIRDQFELELLGWGYPLLAVSARCSTARVHGRNRKQCLKVCQETGAEQADSLINQPMFTINGTQLHSAEPWDLLSQLQQLRHVGVQWLRICPKSLDNCEWLDALAAAIAIEQHEFAAPLPGRGDFWSRGGIAEGLCAD
ncbi:U32 family peptidase [Ferrimonas lipolytica]|uniref:Uncharacterized protein n=1 Tax=Ferrimonas lipolytica TaxID=2724191 RepID=A0A6H1UE98_9GAMM|nr:U32 family peptidase [Ferrimonas lipolytica]QIZ77415.1 hypothetical protein HER31_11295 [Ferrimonas lipolytica]